MKNCSSFFKNCNCEYFPSHKTENEDEFNCLFCFCPLYNLPDCGGNFCLTANGNKDCSNCLLPHKAGNYDYIISKLNNSDK